MEEGVVQLVPRIVRIEADVAGLGKDVAELKKDVSDLKKDVSGLKEDVSGLKEKVDALGVNQARFHDDLRDLRGSLDSKFIWIVTTMIAFGTALLAAMAKGFHWFE